MSVDIISVSLIIFSYLAKMNFPCDMMTNNCAVDTVYIHMQNVQV